MFGTVERCDIVNLPVIQQFVSTNSAIRGMINSRQAFVDSEIPVVKFCQFAPPCTIKLMNMESADGFRIKRR